MRKTSASSAEAPVAEEKSVAKRAPRSRKKVEAPQNEEKVEDVASEVAAPEKPKEAPAAETPKTEPETKNRVKNTVIPPMPRNLVVRDIVDLWNARIPLLNDQQIQQLTLQEAQERHLLFEAILAQVLDYDIVLSDTNIWLELLVGHTSSHSDPKVNARLMFERQLEFISKLMKKKGGRFVIMAETYGMFGGRGRGIEPFMAALEMIHSYSLVHDDLPAMDNDELRRGEPTTHKVYGEAMAILAGDGLLNLSFETALKAFELEPDNPNIPGALKVLFDKSGLNGMLGGQSVDVKNEKAGTDPDISELEFIYENKTSRLLEAAAMTGAILAGAGEEDVKRLERMAVYLGIAFQIKDDILDVEGDEAVLGKPVGSDEKNGKVTYITYKGLEGAKNSVREYSDKALGEAAALSVRSEFLENLIKYLVDRDK